MGFIGRLVARLLNAYRRYRRWVLALRGSSEADESYQNVASGAAWEEFCEQLKGAGAAILAPGAPRDALTQAEAYRYLTRLVRGGLENFIEASDPLAPRLVSIANGLREAPVKLGSDSPDNLYENAAIEGARTYRVHGARGTVAYLGFGVQAGSYGAPGGLQTVSYAESSELRPCPPPAGRSASEYPGGYIELWVAPERPDGALNWLRSAREPRDGMLLVRHTFLDRARETPARLDVELVGPDGSADSGGAAAAARRQLSPAQLEEGLRKTALLVAGAPLMFNGWIRSFQPHVNTLPLFDVERSNKAGGDPNIRYYHSYWRVGHAEALVVRAAPPPCDNWNFVLCNHWMESLDYRHERVHVNKLSAEYAADGSVCVVVSHRPPPRALGGKGGAPGAPANWLDPCGHTCGVMTWRWIRPGVPDAELPQPACTLSTYDALLL